jgi:phi13 family phage major tail protein
MDKKFGLLRGLSDIYICEIEDTEEAYTPVGTPEKLIPAGELTISKSVEKAQTYFDNSLFAEVGKEAASELSIVGAAVRAAFLAWIEGKTVDAATGAVLDDGVWHSKFFAISGKRDYTDGTSEYFWFNKCSFNGAEETGKTEDDSTDSAGMTLPFIAYKTTHKFKNGKTSKAVRIDTATTKLMADASWTAQVVTPDNLAEFCEKVTVTE